jgi:hypothetical protein
VLELLSAVISNISTTAVGDIFMTAQASGGHSALFRFHIRPVSGNLREVLVLSGAAGLRSGEEAIVEFLLPHGIQLAAADASSAIPMLRLAVQDKEAEFLEDADESSVLKK